MATSVKSKVFAPAPSRPQRHPAVPGTASSVRRSALPRGAGLTLPPTC